MDGNMYIILSTIVLDLNCEANSNNLPSKRSVRSIRLFVYCWLGEVSQNFSK